MDEPWYILEFKSKPYLHNKVLSYKHYTGDVGDHSHCELCWDRFSKHPIDLQIGYYEEDSESWICPDCYNNFASLFGWKLDDSDHLLQAILTNKCIDDSIS